MLVLLLKTLLLVVLAILFRSALPRYRVDQLLVLNWKIFIYYFIFFILYLILICVFFYF